MKVKIIAEIEADIQWTPDNVINNDTIGDYKAELDCNIENAACDQQKMTVYTPIGTVKPCSFRLVGVSHITDTTAVYVQIFT